MKCMFFDAMVSNPQFAEINCAPTGNEPWELRREHGLISHQILRPFLLSLWDFKVPVKISLEGKMDK